MFLIWFWFSLGFLKAYRNDNPKTRIYGTNFSELVEEGETIGTFYWEPFKIGHYYSKGPKDNCFANLPHWWIVHMNYYKVFLQ
jgi:hypothetical protein